MWPAFIFFIVPVSHKWWFSYHEKCKVHFHFSRFLSKLRICVQKFWRLASCDVIKGIKRIPKVQKGNSLSKKPQQLTWTLFCALVGLKVMRLSWGLRKRRLKTRKTLQCGTFRRIAGGYQLLLSSYINLAISLQVCRSWCLTSMRILFFLFVFFPHPTTTISWPSLLPYQGADRRYTQRVPLL